MDFKAKNSKLTHNFLKLLKPHSKRGRIIRPGMFGKAIYKLIQESNNRKCQQNFEIAEKISNKNAFNYFRRKHNRKMVTPTIEMIQPIKPNIEQNSVISFHPKLMSTPYEDEPLDKPPYQTRCSIKKSNLQNDYNHYKIFNENIGRKIEDINSFIFGKKPPLLETLKNRLKVIDDKISYINKSGNKMNDTLNDSYFFESLLNSPFALAHASQDKELIKQNSTLPFTPIPIQNFTINSTSDQTFDLMNTKFNDTLKSAPISPYDDFLINLRDKPFTPKLNFNFETTKTPQTDLILSNTSEIFADWKSPINISTPSYYSSCKYESISQKPCCNSFCYNKIHISQLETPEILYREMEKFKSPTFIPKVRNLNIF